MPVRFRDARGPLRARLRSWLALAGGLALAWLTLPGSASAVAIDYTITQGSEPQFNFSFLHGASRNCCGAPSEYLNSGPKLFRLGGILSGNFTSPPDRLDFSADVDLTATVLSPTVPGASVGDVWTLRLLAGSFMVEQANGRTSGLLGYELFDNDDLANPVATAPSCSSPRPPSRPPRTV